MCGGVSWEGGECGGVSWEGGEYMWRLRQNSRQGRTVVISVSM